MTNLTQEEIQSLLDNASEIAGLLQTQDNRYTQDPIFAVIQKKRIYGFDSGFCDDYVWCHPEHEYPADDEKAEELDEKADDYDETCGEWYKVFYKDDWEFVTACLTEKGCQDYIDCNGHNLNEPRICAYSAYRNAEFIFLRKYIAASKDLAKQCIELMEALDEAVDEIADWGCYASPYFQEKHDLKGTIERLRKVLPSPPREGD